MAKTIQDRLCAALAARGHREETGKTRKYRVFFRHNHDDGTPIYFYVGESGALRVGRNTSESFSLERSRLRAELLKEVP